MQIIKLDATDSTNDYLKTLTLSETLTDFTVVVAGQQLNGRGQMGTKWLSDPGKNLTFSVLKNNLHLSASDSFLLNVTVSIAIYKCLEALNVPDLYIKWPNDILSGSSKICGILIENLLSGNKINTAIVGIGLNVNQLHFESLQNVASLKLLLGRTFNVDELLSLIVKNLKNVFSEWKEKGVDSLRETYKKTLFRKDKPSTFEDRNGDLFMGFIRGISDYGKLVVELEDSIMEEFDLKEIRLLY